MPGKIRGPIAERDEPLDAVNSGKQPLQLARRLQDDASAA
jgi:hypothetical protein